MSAENSTAPLPALLRPALRTVIRMWARSGRKSEYLMRTIERCGARAAGRPLLTRLPNGCELLCDLRDVLQRHIYFLGLSEAIESYLFMLLLKPGMTVVDAGANVGEFTLLAATGVAPGGSVHSFEPVPTTFERLRQNIRRNGLVNVTPVRSALWNAETELTLGLDGTQHELGNSARWSIGAQLTAPVRVAAPGIRLDDYVREHRLARVDLIKIDTEGAEPFVLTGARDILRQWQPIVLAEVNRLALQRIGTSPNALWDEMRRLDYRAWLIGYSPRRSGPLGGLDGIELANVIFYHDELPRAVTAGWSRRTPKRWACSGW